MKLYNQIESWLTSRAKNVVHRQLLVISGDEPWAVEQAIKLCATNDDLWLGNSEGACSEISPQQYQNFLGQEYNTLVFNAYTGFRANAAIALSGIVTKNGLMILICPELDSWPRYPDPDWANRVSYGFQDALVRSHFIDKFIKTIKQDENVALLTKEGFQAALPLAPKEALTENALPAIALQQQELAVENIIKVATGHRNRPLVLSADRGRGKSAALGIAAAKLMLTKGKKIALVAPSPSTVQHVFSHAKHYLPEAQHSKNKLSFNEGYLQYIAPDAILAQTSDFELLLIDEAAALPTHLLYKLIDRFSRIVFSTTLHGYEGSGRGFDLRVKEYLNVNKPQWRNLHLTYPMRWYKGDCLESFWFNALCMHNTPCALPYSPETEMSCRFVSQVELVQDTQLSHDLFQLLIEAHYQTSPDDLIRLFDSPEQRCFVLVKGNELVGVALVIEEGGERLAPLHQDIAAGKRRVKGHLVAQNIAFNYAYAEFCQHKQWRISRIAIASAYQSRGLGQQLIDHIIQHAQTRDIAFLTTSFGASVRLLKFWQRAGFTLVNLSKKPEISSAQHSAQLIYPVAEQVKNIEHYLKNVFLLELCFQSDKAFSGLEPLLLHHALASLHSGAPLEPINLEIIKQFIDGTRPLNVCLRSLRAYYLKHILVFKKLDKQHLALVVATLMQNRSFAAISKEFSVTGKHQIEMTIRNALKLIAMDEHW